MNVLVLAEHWAVASGRYVVDALRRMGHDVRTMGTEHGTAIWGGEVDAQYVWTAQPPEKGWMPELVIIADAHLPAKAAKDWPCPVVVYGVDNHVRTYEQYGVDHFFLGHGHGYRIGEENASWLPCGYDPHWFTPGPDWDEREFDAALIGVIYNERASLLYAVLGAVPGIKLAYGTGAVYVEYAGIYQNARISLVKSAAGDVAQRVWETAAMGCLVVMDECPDCEALGLVEGENCLMYRTTEEAARKVKWALEHPDEAAAIATVGQIWAQAGTWDARVQVIVDWVNGHAPMAQKVGEK